MVSISHFLSLFLSLPVCARSLRHNSYYFSCQRKGRTCWGSEAEEEEDEDSMSRFMMMMIVFWCCEVAQMKHDSSAVKNLPISLKSELTNDFQVIEGFSFLFDCYCAPVVKHTDFALLVFRSPTAAAVSLCIRGRRLRRHLRHRTSRPRGVPSRRRPRNLPVHPGHPAKRRSWTGTMEDGVLLKWRSRTFSCHCGALVSARSSLCSPLLTRLALRHRDLCHHRCHPRKPARRTKW